jgi:hypothetical protein
MLAFAFACASACAPAAPWAGGADTASASATLERSVKAAFLYKFLGYAEFPASAFGDAAAPLLIGVVDAEELAAELRRVVAGRTVNQRPMVVRSFREGDTPAGMHLLFIGGGDGARIREVLKSLAPGALLVVSEAEQGLQQGSAINFKIIEQRVRFDVSLEAAERNQIRLSSRLLSVANQVVKGAP